MRIRFYNKMTSSYWNLVDTEVNRRFIEAGEDAGWFDRLQEIETPVVDIVKKTVLSGEEK